jgi:hypothetical protein
VLAPLDPDVSADEREDDLLQDRVGPLVLLGVVLLTQDPVLAEHDEDLGGLLRDHLVPDLHPRLDGEPVPGRELDVLEHHGMRPHVDRDDLGDVGVDVVRPARDERLLDPPLPVRDDVRVLPVLRRLVTPPDDLHPHLLRLDLHRRDDLHVVHVRVQPVLPRPQDLLDDPPLARLLRGLQVDGAARQELAPRLPLRLDLRAGLPDQHGTELLRHLDGRVRLERVEERVEEVPALRQDPPLDPFVRRVRGDHLPVRQWLAPSVRHDQECVRLHLDAGDGPQEDRPREQQGQPAKQDEQPGSRSV